MKKFIIIALSIIFISCNKNDDNIAPNPVINESLQDILDAHQGNKSIPGLSSAVYFYEGDSIWTGVAGNSHADISINSEMLFGIASNTKLFTAVLCLKLQEQGMLNLDSSIHHFLPSIEYVDPNITVRQLLKHESGVFDYTTNPAFLPAVLNDLSHFWTPEEILQYINAPIFEPGTSSGYSDTNYILAGMILESVSGKTYEELLELYIFTPLNLQHTYVGWSETEGETFAHPWEDFSDILSNYSTSIFSSFWAAGCIVSTPKEMASWYHNLFNGNVLNPSSLAELSDFSTWDFGLGIIRMYDEGNEYWVHPGAAPGYSSVFIYDVSCKNSVILMENDSYKLSLSNLAFKLAKNACK